MKKTNTRSRIVSILLVLVMLLTMVPITGVTANAADTSWTTVNTYDQLKAALSNQNPPDNIKLGSDVTIHYITGVRKMNLTNSDLQIDSPYNTYKYAGLPVGPICNPSAEAITAALYPDETYVAENYLYFCSKDPESGELYFSKTQAEHDQAVAIYAPLWQAYDESRGIE